MAWWRKKNWEDEYDEGYSRERRPRKASTRLRILPHLLAIGFIAALFVGGVGAVAGTTMFEKTLTALASPTGLIWILLFLTTYFSLLMRYAWPAFLGIVCWLLLTAAGNGYISGWLISTIEEPYQQIDPLELEPFDVIVLLGGGTDTRINGSVQVNAAGDRVMTAARMFQRGLARKIICTGSQPLRSSKEDLHPREEAHRILRDLGVPENSISQLKADNTSQEMKNLAEVFETQGHPNRVGIVTSAWHMRRAMILAKSNGLDVEPVPANFLSSRFTPGPDLIIPSSGNLTVTSIVVKEHLATWVGR